MRIDKIHPSTELESPELLFDWSVALLDSSMRDTSGHKFVDGFFLGSFLFFSFSSAVLIFRAVADLPISAASTCVWKHLPRAPGVPAHPGELGASLDWVPPSLSPLAGAASVPVAPLGPHGGAP